MIRLSTIQAYLRNSGLFELADSMERIVNNEGRTCKKHGRLEDPCVLLVSSDEWEGIRLMVGCPWCSTSDILRKWELEGEH